MVTVFKKKQFLISTFDLAAYKLEQTIKYLKTNNFYPTFTANKLLDNKSKLLLILKL